MPVWDRYLEGQPHPQSEENSCRGHRVSCHQLSPACYIMLVASGGATKIPLIKVHFDFFL